MQEDHVDEECEPQSMVHINAASELFPLKPMQVDGENSSATVPFNVLSGESVLFLDSTNDGLIAISNYRLFISGTECGVVNVPLIMVDQIEYRDVFFLHIYCKDATYSRCAFATNDKCLEWYRRLLAATLFPKKLEDLFAFPFYAWCCEEKKDELYELLHHKVGTIDMMQEIERLGLDKHTSDEVWRVSDVNKDYSLSRTYPPITVVPNSLKDKDVCDAAEFRSLHRFPTITWRHRKNGCVLGRCSQPMVGLLGWRNNHDEAFIKAIAEACAKKKSPDSSGADSTPDEPAKLLIVDARSYSAALANRAKGGGCECPEYYPNCEIQFMGLANIHSIRKSFQGMRMICVNPPDQSSWYSALENTRWLNHISALIRSAMCIVNAIDKECCPVIVHCSDGWDRTPQIVALAELILDPYYRTLEGFQVLVEREWLQFGHKFGDRCGSGIDSDDTNERCPVFLQWLDCVHQLMKQYPCSFEFQDVYLIKLVHHVYSCLFGTFMCNTDKERRDNRVFVRTFSIWSFFKSYHQRFRNHLYIYKDQVLRPSYHVRDMHFWSTVYLPPKNSNILNSEDHELSQAFVENHIDTSSCQNGSAAVNLVKTRSCDDISISDPVLEVAPDKQRRLSDPNLAEHQRNGLEVAIFSTTNNDVDHNTKNEVAEETEEPVITNGTGDDCIEQSEEVSEAIDYSSVQSVVNEIEGEESSTPEGSQSNSDNSLWPSETRTLKNRLATGIEGSTDTLVGVSNALGSASNCDSDKLESGACNGCCYSFKCISTSTSEISDSVVTIDSTAKPQPVILGNCRQSLCNSCSASSQKSKKKTPSYSRQTSTSSAVNSIYSTPMHSRTPSSGFPATPSEDCRLLSDGQGNASSQSISCRIDVDGLTLTVDMIQQRLHQLFSAHKAEVESLKKELYMARLALSQQYCSRCSANNNCSNPSCQDHSDDASLPDSSLSGENQSLGHESNDLSDCGWEHVTEKDVHPTLWVPDHAVSKCSYCDIEFWLGRRKHHCRNCGQIFCAQCSDHLASIPDEQLYQPVRVCKGCYNSLHCRFRTQKRSAIMSCSTGCKNKIINRPHSVGTAEALN